MVDFLISLAIGVAVIGGSLLVVAIVLTWKAVDYVNRELGDD